MEVSGDSLVPVRSTLTLRENCGALMIQVIADAPQTLTRSRAQIGSLNARLRVRTAPSRPWIISTATTNVTRMSALSSIQTTLDRSPAGSVVLIPAGHYFESLNVTKPVTLIGTATGQTGRAKLFGGIRIVSPNVTLDGLSLYPSDLSVPAIEIMAATSILIHNCTVGQDRYKKDTVLMRSASGIRVSNSSHVKLINDIVRDTGVGISLHNCSGCSVQSNLLQSCWHALAFEDCEGLNVIGNYFRENVAAMSSLVEYEAQGRGFSMEGNVFENNIDSTTSRRRLAGSVGGGGVSSHQHRDSSGQVGKASKVIVTGTCSGERVDDSTRSLDGCAYIQGE